MSARASVAGVDAGSIRQAGAADLEAIARIHCRAFPDAFLTSLGPRFLRIYYGLVERHPGGILLVQQDSAGVNGFVAGFAQPGEFYRRLKATRRSMAGCLSTALIRKPALAGRIFYHVWRLRSERSRVHAGECELSSLGVRPEGWNRGIGGLLVRAFLEQAWSRGAQGVYLTTEAAENQRVNLFYRRLGFELRECFEQYRGRLLNEYVFRRIEE